MPRVYASLLLVAVLFVAFGTTHAIRARYAFFPFFSSIHLFLFFLIISPTFFFYFFVFSRSFSALEFESESGFENEFTFETDAMANAGDEVVEEDTTAANGVNIANFEETFKEALVEEDAVATTGACSWSFINVTSVRSAVFAPLK